MTSRSMTLNELRQQLDAAKSLLGAERRELLALHPLNEAISREAYSFAYIRAERAGMRVINRKLASINWLPMQLDARAEVMGENRHAMKRWIKGDGVMPADAEAFGNDFIHALARAGLGNGWDNGVTVKLASRIGNLFRDLSCLIGLIYYCSWLEDHNVARFPLNADGDLVQTAEDMALLLESAHIADHVRAQEQERDLAARELAAHRALPQQAKKKPPALRLIKNHEFPVAGLPGPEPLPV